MSEIATEAGRVVVDVLVGPCSEDEVEALMVAIANLDECKQVAGVVACHPLREDVNA